MNKKIIIIVIVLLGLGAAVYFFGMKQDTARPVFHDRTLQDFSNMNGFIKNVFLNKTYNYSIEYPDDWDFYINDKSRVTFGDPTNDFPGPHFSVVVSTTSASTIRELKDEIKYARYDAERVINSYPALEAHRAGEVEEYLQEKVLYVLKDGFVYEIEIDFMDAEAVWKSFKFLDK